MARGLFAIHVPDAVPVRGRWTGLKVVDALEEGQRWSVVGGDLQSGPERIACVIPALRPVSGQSFRISVPQGRLSCRQRPRLTHDLEHGLRPGLAEHDKAIDLA